MISKLRAFLRESFSELKRVNWPTRQETIRLTIVVIIMSLILAGLLGFFDMLFSYILNNFII